MKKVKELTHCCKDCLFTDTIKGTIACIIADPHFNKQPLNKINICPNWQN